MSNITDINNLDKKYIFQLIKEGDIAIVYLSHDKLDHMTIQKDAKYDNKYGNFQHNDMIGKAYGTKIYSNTSNGWIYLLQPTPELWGLALATRTQIVDEIDSSIVIFGLDLYPGCKVIESGTGSGCMTLAIARAVLPLGKVFTYEFNSIRAKQAEEDFAKFKLSHIIDVTCRDVCGKYKDNQGDFINVDDCSIDAVFLDLPEPWLALNHVLRVLKPSKTVCCYSPCMEQVMKTCDKLIELGFYNIRMFESRHKAYDVRNVLVEEADLGQANIDHDTYISDKPTFTLSENELFQFLKEDEIIELESPLKKIRSEEATEADIDKESIIPDKFKRTYFNYKPMESSRKQLSKPVASIKGHTAFLTFACAPTHEILNYLKTKK